jgi:aryl-alcohol dehydrogenase-like predicted oxidoreductase
MSAPALPHRRLGPFSVSAIGLGCMNLSHAYGQPPERAAAQALLHRALDLGVDFFDTAALYGFGANETLLGETLGPLRQRFTLASKCGMQGVDGVRVIDGRPATLKATCEAALQRLRTEVIDLYYLHRWDKTVPIEDSVGAGGAGARGQDPRDRPVRGVGRDAAPRPCGAPHCRPAVRIFAVDPQRRIRRPAGLPRTGRGLRGLQPLGRGYLTGALTRVDDLAPKDIRRAMPASRPRPTPATWRRWSPQALAEELGCSLAQLALAWLLHQGEDILPIPGTTRLDHLEEDLGALQVRLSPEQVQRISDALPPEHIVGGRYNAATEAEVDTETHP